MIRRKLSFPFILQLFLTCFAVCVIAEEPDKWSMQLAELKAMMAALDSKLSQLDSKLSEVNFLEYAFKVNSVDNQLTLMQQSVNNIEGRMHQLDVQGESIKELIRSLPSSGSSCREHQTEKKATQAQSSHSSVRGGGGDDNVLCRGLTQKVEDYSYKLAKSQQELKEEGGRHQQALSHLLDTVKNGFTKTFQKVDVLPNTERQISRISSGVSRLSNQLPEAVEKLKNISSHLTIIQREISKVTLSTSNTASKSDEKFTASLVHALELGNRVRTDLQQLAQVEPDILRSTRMARNLLTGLDPRRPTSMETLKNLTITLEAIETTAVPLLFSIPYNFEGVYELLDTTLASAEKNVTGVCNFQEVFRLEMKKISDSIENQKPSECLVENVQGSVSKSADVREDITAAATMKQKEVFENLSYVRSALVMIRTDLKELFRNCPDNSIPTLKPLGMILG